MSRLKLDTFNARLSRALNVGTSADVAHVLEQGERYGDSRVKRAVKYRRATFERQAARAAAERAERDARVARGEVLRIDAKPAPIDVSGPHCHSGHGGVFPSVYSTTKADKAYCRELKPYKAAPELDETPDAVKWDMYRCESVHID